MSVFVTQIQPLLLQLQEDSKEYHLEIGKVTMKLCDLQREMIQLWAECVRATLVKTTEVIMSYAPTAPMRADVDDGYWIVDYNDAQVDYNTTTKEFTALYKRGSVQAQEAGAALRTWVNKVDVATQGVYTELYQYDQHTSVAKLRSSGIATVTLVHNLETSRNSLNLLAHIDEEDAPIAFHLLATGTAQTHTVKELLEMLEATKV